MRFFVDSKKLSAALANVLQAIPARPVQPVLASVYLAAFDSNIAVTGTDLEMTITSEVEAKVEDSGECLLDAQKFAAIVREMTDDVLIFSEKDAVRIAGNASSFKLPTYDPKEFPLDESEYEPDCVISAKDFVDMAVKIRPVVTRKDQISEKGVQLATSGILVESDGQNFFISACDKYRAAVVSKECDFPEISGKILTSKAFNAACKMADCEVKISFSDSQFVFKSGSTTMISRLLAGTFPPWKKVWPKSFKHKVELPSDFYSAIRKAMVMLEPEEWTVVLEFRNDAVLVSVPKEDTVNVCVELKSSYSGTIRIDPDALIDTLNHVEDCCLKINSSEEPIELSGGNLKVLSMTKLSPKQMEERKK